MKKYLLAIIGFVLVAGIVQAAPASTILRNILPEGNNTYDIGSTTPSAVWKNVFTQSLTLTGLPSENCIGTSASGLLQSGTCTGGGGGGTSDFTYVTAAGGRYLTPTSTVVGLLTPYTASSTLAKLTMVLSTTTQATTTNFYASGLSVMAGGLTLTCTSCITDVNVADLAVGGDVTGTLSAIAVTDNSHLHDSTSISGIDISADTNLTGGAGLTLTGDDMACDTATAAVFGCLTAADWTTFNNKVATSRALTIAGTSNQITSSAGSQDLSADRTWTLSLPNHVIFPSSFVATLGSTTQATTTYLAVTNAPIFSSLTGVLKGNGSSPITVAANGTDFTLITATTCGGTDKVSAITAGGAITCSADETGGGGGGGGAVEFTYTIPPSTTVNSGLYLTPTSTLVGLLTANTSSSTIMRLTMNLATSTQATTSYLQIANTASSSEMIISNLLKIPFGTNPTVDATGKISINTTSASSSLRFYDGVAERSLFGEIYPSTIYASSSLEYDGAFGAAGTTTYIVAHYPRPVTLISVYCKTDVGTAYYTAGTGTASSTVNCSSSGVESTTNVSFLMRQAYYVSIGTSANTPNRITVTEQIRIDAD